MLRAYVRPQVLTELTADQKKVQQWTGELKYCDDIMIMFKYLVHVLSHHMAYPPAEQSLELLLHCTRRHRHHL